MAPSRIEWSGQPPGRLASAVRHLGVGFVVAIGLVLVFLLSRVALAGSSRFVVFFVTILVVGGPFSLLYLWYGLRYGEEVERRALATHLPSVRLRWVVLAVPVCFVALYGIALAPWLFLVYLAVGLAVWTVATTGRMGGVFDTETGELVREGEDRRYEHDLGGLRSLRAFRFGPYVVCLLRHRRGKVLDEPFGLVFPASVFDDLRPALTRVVERNAADDDDQSGMTADRWLLVAFGGLFVGIAALLELFGPPSAEGMGLVIAAWGLLFVLLAWVA